MTPRICACGHSEFLHEIRRDHSRSRCYFIAGPRGIQCGCLAFREEGAENVAGHSLTPWNATEHAPG